MQKQIDIKKLRKLKNWTQSKMGEHFGVDISTVWRWEKTGIPSRGASRKAIEREWEAAHISGEVEA